MGIDIYILNDENDNNWCVNDAAAQLRESYHGGPYATKILCREAFDAEDCKAEIPAATLRERLTQVTEPATQSFNHMGALVAMLGKIFSSEKPPEGSFGFTLDDEMIKEHANEMRDTTHPMSVEEAIRERYRTVYPDAEPSDVDAAVRRFQTFVEFAENRERETGKPCKIYASY
jgi:hypothetical protein